MSNNKNNKKIPAGKDDKVIFHYLDLGTLEIPPYLLGKYKEYFNVLWKTNVYFGFDDLSEKDKTVLEKIEFDIVFFQKNGLVPLLLFIINKNLHTKDMKSIVSEKGDIEFAKRLLNCMYSDLNMLSD